MAQEPTQVQGKAMPFEALMDETLQVGAWKTGFFSCFSSLLPNCLCSAFCPCITFGQIVARLGVGDFFTTAAVVFILYCTGFGAIFVWLYLWYIRSKLRYFLSLPGSCCGDCCATFFCNCCVLA
ncbi:Aste57867_15934 [Aphanomyces stellatus]|uniref:Aste57867_15934 protein n=1 Tax=Aphanomyces stellatus TaxID=120398 RepID=A0A485L4L2_9STRA|nr:hypothetical protein As57867_015878 [Aphanomyces stellatus]VFT92720.1 Aste57867_15934 [Aphanomyces stellatus]